MHNARLAATVIVCAAAAVGIAGCGGSSHRSPGPTSALAGMTPTEFADRSYETLGSVPSVTMAFSEDGSAGKSDVKLTLDSKGDCSGTLTSNKATFQILKVGSTSWIKMSQEPALTGLIGPAEAPRAVGKYLAVADYPQLKSFVKACDIKSEISSEERPNEVTEVGNAMVNGTATIEFKEHKSDGDTLTWIAAQGDPNIVEIRTPHVTAFLSDYGKPATFHAPSSGEIA
jgi:hypothetical protein